MAPLLRIHNLWKSHVAGVHGCSARVWALRGCSLTVHAGERIAIAGRAGSGKSTLLQCIARLRHADAGRIESDFAQVVYTPVLPLPVPRAERRAASLYLIDDLAAADAPAVASLLAAPLHDSALIIATRNLGRIATMVERVLTLRDGRLVVLPHTPIRRVAEPPASVLSAAASGTREPSTPGTALG